MFKDKDINAKTSECSTTSPMASPQNALEFAF